jgi:hypothetical protein
MAVLSDAERFALWTKFMAKASDERQSLSLTKPDLRAAVDAIDGWVDSNDANAKLTSAYDVELGWVVEVFGARVKQE